jgi:hypothetical protein
VRRTDHSSRGVLPGMLCLSVIEEPRRGGLGPLEVSIHEKKKIMDYPMALSVHQNIASNDRMICE